MRKVRPLNNNRTVDQLNERVLAVAYPLSLIRRHYKGAF